LPANLEKVFTYSWVIFRTFKLFFDSYFDVYTVERGYIKSAQSEFSAEKSDKESPKHRCLGLV